MQSVPEQPKHDYNDATSSPTSADQKGGKKQANM